MYWLCWISPGMISVNNMAASSMSRSARTVMSSTPRREAECTHVQQNKNQIIVATEVEERAVFPKFACCCTHFCGVRSVRLQYVREGEIG